MDDRTAISLLQLQLLFVTKDAQIGIYRQRKMLKRHPETLWNFCSRL